MKKLLTLALVLCMGLSLAGCSARNLAGALQSAMPSQSTPAPATPTPEPATPTPEPATPTPEPATPTPAAQTPAPTAPVSSMTEEEKTEALLHYINVDLVDIADVESLMLNSYNGVTGVNYTDDATLYLELSTNTLPLAQQLNTLALAVASGLTDPEISLAHSKYLTYTSSFISALNTMLDALEQQSRSLVNEANEKLNQANQVVLEYQRDIYALADARNVTIGS